MKAVLLKIFFALCFFALQIESFGQAGLAKGDAMQNISVKKILNANAAKASFRDLQNKLTIIDFFGTWCAPCLRALPHLASIAERHKEDVSIILVSTETEGKLQKFINARTNFLFPVIVDEDNRWNDLFQPPSLPYTVVIKEGKVIAITNAEAITGDAIKQWLNEPAASLPPTQNKVQHLAQTMVTNRNSSNAAVRLSQQYIYAAKTGEPVTALAQQVNDLSYQELLSTLDTDNKKKAFWINLYNAYTQAALAANPGKYKNRAAFFKQKNIGVAGKMYSLDDIEHGILRRSKIKWSLGHLGKLFPSKSEKNLRVKDLDYRIHFALNCGAKSCPPIAFYNDESLDAQLDLASKSYLTGEAIYDSAKNIIRLPKLMSWFRADFGGKKGMITILRQHGIIAAGAKPKVEFKDYDWTLALNNYTTQNP